MCDVNKHKRKRKKKRKRKRKWVRKGKKEKEKERERACIGPFEARLSSPSSCRASSPFHTHSPLCLFGASTTSRLAC
jgi:hypothetical protein